MIKRLVIIVTIALCTLSLSAQEETSSTAAVDNGIDLVSGYVFRGVVFDNYRPQVQGWASYTKGNFTCGL